MALILTTSPQGLRLETPKAPAFDCTFALTLAQTAKQCDQPKPANEFGLVTGIDGSPRYAVRHNGAGFEGSGIGLPTARHVIERHGGSISAQIDQGATIYVNLEPNHAARHP